MDLISLAYEVGLNPRKVSETLGGEYHSECPRCGGVDRFIINPSRQMKNCTGSFWCRQCGIRGDSIQFCREFLGLSYKDAISRTNASIPKQNPFFMSRKKPQSFSPAQLVKPPQKWIEKANDFKQRAHREILQRQNILDWLAKRGISETTVKQYYLGWNKDNEYHERADWGIDPKLNNEGRPMKLCLPCGLVIPYIDPQSINTYRIKIRREGWKKDDELPRYMAISGSMNGLNIFGNKDSASMICVESELDAIYLASIVGDKAVIVAVGGCIKNPDYLVDFLAKTKKQILICHDNDSAGLKMLKKWLGLYSHAKPCPTPFAKDIGEAVESGFDVERWVLDKLLNT